MKLQEGGRPEADVLELVRGQSLPGRRIGAEWRFLKAAIQDWLRVPGKEAFWSRHFGALKDDPYLQEMVGQIYRDRGSQVPGGDE